MLTVRFVYDGVLNNDPPACVHDNAPPCVWAAFQATIQILECASMKPSLLGRSAWRRSLVGPQLLRLIRTILLCWIRLCSELDEPLELPPLPLEIWYTYIPILCASCNTFPLLQTLTHARVHSFLFPCFFDK